MFELAVSHSPKDTAIYSEFKKIMILKNDCYQDINGIFIVNLELKVATLDEENLQKFLAEWFLHINITKNDFKNLGISHKQP